MLNLLLLNICFKSGQCRYLCQSVQIWSNLVILDIFAKSGQVCSNLVIQKKVILKRERKEADKKRCETEFETRKKLLCGQFYDSWTSPDFTSLGFG